MQDFIAALSGWLSPGMPGQIVTNFVCKYTRSKINLATTLYFRTVFVSENFTCLIQLVKSIGRRNRFF